MLQCERAGGHRGRANKIVRNDGPGPWKWVSGDYGAEHMQDALREDVRVILNRDMRHGAYLAVLAIKVALRMDVSYLNRHESKEHQTHQARCSFHKSEVESHHGYFDNGGRALSSQAGEVFE